jgi:hypothetical protein
MKSWKSQPYSASAVLCNPLKVAIDFHGMKRKNKGLGLEKYINSQIKVKTRMRRRFLLPIPIGMVK